MGARAGGQGGDLTGVSGGSTFGVAMQVAEKAPAGSVILAMLPDTGERYLSTPLFEPFGPDMNEDELELMRSTPGYQLELRRRRRVRPLHDHLELRGDGAAVRGRPRRART